LDKFWKEIRYAARILASKPAFTAVCVLTLALGIGANTAVFSIVNALLFRPLPVKDPQQLTVLAFRQKHGPLNSNFSFGELRDLRAQSSECFSDVFAYQLGLDGLSVNGKAERIVTAFVSGNFFSALGIQPALGRFISPGEGEVPGSGPGIVLSYDYWQSRFNRANNIIGQKVLLDGHPVTVIGVAPKEFHGLYSIASMHAFIPLGMAEFEGVPGDFMENRALRNLTVLGRIRPGRSLTQAQAALNVAARRISQNHPESDKDLSLAAFPELRARPSPDNDNTLLLISTLFLALAALVLLLACVNVANMLLVRATIRQREMAIRVALGAARGTLIRQLLTESSLLALCGGAAGILLGCSASSRLSSLRLGTDLPVRLDFGFDWRVFGYAFLGAILTGLVVGLVPALRASKANVNDILQQGGRGSVGARHRFRDILVSAQVAASLMLLIIAGLFARSLTQAQQIPLGFDPAHVVNFDMDPTQIGYSEAQGQALYRQVLERVRALPNVQAASLAASVPMGYIGSSDNVLLSGRETPPGQPDPPIGYNVVTPGYFETMNIRLLHGRAFTSADKADTVFAALVNQTMAEKFWHGQDPIGRQFQMASELKHTLRVVGVASDIRQRATGPVRSFFYVPLAQHYANNSFETLQVRTAGDPKMIIPEVQRSVHALAPDLPVFDVATMTESLYTMNGLLRFQIAAGLAGVLGLLGLLLAVVGVYGVISYAATQQTHEIGLRMALGAKPLNILQMVFRRGLLIVGIGLAVGLAGTVAAADLVGKFVVVSPTDPLTYSAVSALLTAVALFACYIPSRRAMRVDPMVALRYD